MTGRYAADTKVPAKRSRDEIERTLERYGADQFAYGWAETGDTVIGFRAHGRMIRFEMPMPDVADYRDTAGGIRRSEGAIEQAVAKAERQRWRALVLVIKAKLEAVESGIVSFEDEFLAHIVLPDGSRMSEWAQPQLERVYASGAMPASIMAALPRGSE